jgi:hypothetical protein
VIQPNVNGYRLTLSMMHLIYFERCIFDSTIIKKQFIIGLN